MRNAEQFLLSCESNKGVKLWYKYVGIYFS